MSLNKEIRFCIMRKIIINRVFLLLFLGVKFLFIAVRKKTFFCLLKTLFSLKYSFHDVFEKSYLMMETHIRMC